MGEHTQLEGDYQARSRVDPLAAPTVAEPDWRAIFRALDEPEGADNADSEALQLAVSNLLDWVLERSSARRGDAARMAGRRLIALAWVMDPNRFGDDPSMSKVAKLLGVHKAILSELTAEFSRKFGLRNRHQKHGWNWKTKGKSK